MKLTQITAKDFDLEKTLNCGQVFHWQNIGNEFRGTIGDLALILEQKGSTLKIRAARSDLDGFKPSRSGTATGRERHLKQIVARYFALDHPLAEIRAAFPDDEQLNAACDFCRGLRIIRQPKWECLATFICSSMKQVAHIRQMSQALRERFGMAREIEGHVLYTFPCAG